MHWVPLTMASDFARGISARLAGVEIPSFEGNEQSFLDLDVLLTKSLTFLDELDSAPFQGSEFKEIVLRPGTPKEKKLSGQVYLSNYGLPQFFSTLRPRTPSCAITVWKSASAITWVHIRRAERGSVIA
jgi:hypothetical protein